MLSRVFVAIHRATFPTQLVVRRHQNRRRIVITTIYIYLVDEGTDVWRPVDAEHLSDNRYRIVTPNANPEDEHWQFQTGTVVRCEWRTLSGGRQLVAVEPLEPAV